MKKITCFIIIIKSLFVLCSAVKNSTTFITEVSITNLSTTLENLDQLLFPGYSFSEPVIISEDTQPGKLLTSIRAKAPVGKSLRFQCYTDGFSCSSKILLNTIYESVYEMKIFANRTNNQHDQDVVLFTYGIGVFETKSHMEPLVREYSGLFLVEHPNHYSPEFSDEGLTMSISSGFQPDTVFSVNLFVNDADRGRNGELSVTCVEEDSPHGGCQAFTVSLAEISHGHYQINLIAKPLAATAKPNDDFGLKLIAVDHPLNMSKQLGAETLILIRIEPSPNATRDVQTTHGNEENTVTPIPTVSKIVNGQPVSTISQKISEETTRTLALESSREVTIEMSGNVPPSEEELSGSSEREISTNRYQTYANDIHISTAKEPSTSSAFVAKIFTQTPSHEENFNSLMNFFNFTNVVRNNNVSRGETKFDNSNTTVPEITTYETTDIIVDENNTTLELTTYEVTTSLSKNEISTIQLFDHSRNNTVVEFNTIGTENQNNTSHEISSSEPGSTTAEYEKSITVNPILAIFNETERVSINITEPTLLNFTENESTTSSTLLSNSTVVFGPEQNIIDLELMQNNPIAVDLSSLISGQPLRGFKVKAKLMNSKVKSLPYILSLMDGHNFSSKIFDVWPNKTMGQSVIYLIIKNISLFQLTFDIDNGRFSFELIARSESWTRSVEVMLHQSASTEAHENMEPQSYNFEVLSNVTSGQVVGSLQNVQNEKSYKIRGSLSSLFRISSSGILTVFCQEKINCLQDYKEKLLSLLIAYENLDSTNYEIVTIKVLPAQESIKLALKFSSKSLTVVNGSVMTPIVITASKLSKLSIVSEDLSKYFELIQLKKNMKWLLNIKEVPRSGNYSLTFNHSDLKLDETIFSSFPIIIEGISQRWRFLQPLYNASIDARSAVKDSFILKFQIQGPMKIPVEFFITGETYGWLNLEKHTGFLRMGVLPDKGFSKSEQVFNVIAVDADKKIQLASTELYVNVYDATFIPEFSKSLFVINVPADTANGVIVQNLTFNNSLPKVYDIVIVKESFKATNKLRKSVPRPINPFTLLQNGSIVINQQLEKLDYASFSFTVNLRSNGTVKSTDMLIYVGPPVHSTSLNAVFAPPWTNHNRFFRVNFPENAPIGSILFSLPVVEPTSLSIVTDVRLAGNYSDHFNVEPKTGIITLVKQLDFEQLPSANFQLKLSAGDERNGTWAILNVTVIDVDDNSPKFINKSVEVYVEENAANGQIVCSLAYYDFDTVGRDFVFKLIGSGSENFQLKRKDDNYVDLTVAPLAQFDFESDVKFFYLLLTVYDGARHEDTCSIRINLLDANDHPPVFVKTNYETQISENLAPGTVIIIVSATDMDSGENGRVTYSLTSPNELFQINPDTGEIKITSFLFDKARPEPYVLEVTASDHGKPENTASTKVFLIVTEAIPNGQHLVFVRPHLNFVLKIKENIPINSTIYTAKVIRANLHNDDGIGIRYSLAKVGSYLDFSIDFYSGNIHLRSLPDRETKPHYAIVVVALDEFTRSNESEIVYRLLTIEIDDEDDNIAQFDRDLGSIPATFSVNADSEIGTLIGYVVAKDVDLASNAEFRYFLTCGNEDGIFKVDSNTGSITTLKLLPTSKDEYKLKILANSTGPSANGTNRLCQQNRINVIDVSIMVNRKTIEQQTLLMIKNNSRISLGRSAIADRLHTMVLAEENVHTDDITYRLVDVEKIDKDKHVTLTGSNLFNVSFHSGAISANPELLAGPQTVYQLRTDAFSADGKNLGRLITYVDVVKDVNKLKFVFSLPVELLESNFTNTASVLINAIKQKTKDSIDIIFDSPMENTYEKSQVCFHLIKEENVLTIEESWMQIKKLTDMMQPIYSSLNIVDIKDCAASIQSASFRTTEIVLIVFCGILLLLTILATIGYFLIVRQYKKYMLEHQQYNVMSAESTSSQNSPELSRNNTSTQQTGYEWKEKSCILD